MSLKIKRVAVLGSGVMGAQIAALLAANGIRVHLLDLASETPPADPKIAKLLGKNFRSSRAIMAIENLKSIKPSPLFSLDHLNSLLPGNFEDDISVLRECDWVLEAVVEKLEIKQQLFKRVLEYARNGIPITSNTSGINLADIARDMPEHFQKVFFGTHFFNPPRYMKLLEVIPHGVTDQKLYSAFVEWSSSTLGKGIVHANDTVNFIANRIGVFVNQSSLKSLEKNNLNIETADVLTGKFMGRPSSATFRTMDVVGLDTFAHVAKNTFDRAPTDPYREWFKMPVWIDELIKAGSLGQKSQSVGCYKKDKDAQGKTVILSYRPEKRSYEQPDIKQPSWFNEAQKEPDLFKRLRFVLSQKDPSANFIWEILRDAFSYSSLLVESIANGLPQSIDDAIRWGFNWDFGPFELWQGLGYDEILTRMKAEQVPIGAWVKPGIKFYDDSPGSALWQSQGPGDQCVIPTLKRQLIERNPAKIRLPVQQSSSDPRVVDSCKSASLVDLGHDVAGLVFHSRMNALDSSIIDFTMTAIGKVSAQFGGLVIANDGEAFSAGANLKELLGVIQKKEWSTLETFIKRFQAATQMIKFAPCPTVSAPHGLVLGGGCEVALHSSQRVCFAETYAGLVEMGVGLIPAGGGTKELAMRAYDLASMGDRGDATPFLQRAFMLIGMAKTSTSAFDAVEMGLFPKGTTLPTMSREFLTQRAKATVLHQLEVGYAAPTPRKEIKVLGDPGYQTFKMIIYNMVEQKQISSHDGMIADRVAKVLSGGECDGGSMVSEQYLLELERNAFLELCQTEKTVQRIEHMLKTGSALRN